MLKVYDFPESVCCQKIRLGLAEKGVDFVTAPVWIDQGEQFSEEFLALNPKAVVPVIEHDGRVVTESTIINEYIDEAFEGPALMPSDPFLRSRKRYWSRVLDDQIHMPHTTALSFVIALRFAILATQDTPEKQQAHLNNIRDPLSRRIQREAFEQGYESPMFKDAVLAFDRMLSDMEKELSTSAWLAGDALSLADLDIAPYVHRLATLQLHPMWDKRPNVARWYEQLQGRPSWKTAITDPHIQKWTELMEATGKDGWPAAQDILAN